MPSKRFIKLTTHNGEEFILNMDYILHVKGVEAGSKITFADNGGDKKLALLVKETPHVIFGHGNS
jgi:hypothetical protein